ncbi:ras-related protein Rab-44 isoform X1 [Tympanuchus pallidicinctus]|uniref:ras-related protein Rab-44 isoform X1 n=1 Tax=Tympanuchus pallidicinctus TaxID=109042 RepID=UPI002286CFE2|nr:ras-related protein Rab-44 isoform X1 [Tympanuchus pallidicinctus]
MAEQRVGSRGRRMGSSRRRQLRRDAAEEPPWAAAVMQKVQDVIQEQHGDTEGFITRADMQKLQEEEVVPCSTEELELLFDGLDAAGTGQLSVEEFTAGLRRFLSSQKISREHRRRKAASRRSCLVLASPTWEETDSEEKKHFAAFMEQLGVDDRWEEQEIWQLWAKLREDEPQLLGNLEDFMAKMRHRIQEARSKKEALEEALNKRVAEHKQEVQQLCEVLEQQIQEERQRMEQESTARSRLHCAMLQRALDARGREVQRLLAAQEELEAQCRSLSSTQRAASAENQQLEENKRVLEEQLQHIHTQLQQTHECLRAAMAQQRAEKPRDEEEAELPSETLPSLQMSPGQQLSEMHVKLGSQGSEPKHRSAHHVVWEKPAADTNPSRLLSVEEDPFPEFLKEERFSGQGSLLREMNDAIAALSRQKLQPLGDAAHCPHHDAELQTGPSGSAPRETHISHKVLEEDPREGRAAAELRAGDGTQAGASAGAQEEGAAQGDSVERAGQSPERMERVLSVQERGAGGEQQVLKEVERPQEALGESTEMGEQAQVGLEGEGWEKMKWEKVQLPGEGENLEAVLKAREVELPAGSFATYVLQVPGCVEMQMAAVQEVREAPNPEKVDGEDSGAAGHCWGEMERTETELQPLSVADDLGTEQAESVGPEEQLLEEADRAEPGLEGGAGAAVLGEGLFPAEIPARSPADGLVLVSAQALEMEEAEDSPASTLLHGIPSPEALRDGLDDTAVHLREDAEDGGQELTEPGLPNQPVCELQGAGARQAEGAAVELSPQEESGSLELLEALSGDTHVQLFAELREIKGSLEAELQPLYPGQQPHSEQAESVGPEMQLVAEVSKPELVEMEGEEDSQVGTQLQWGPSQEAPLEGGRHTAVQLTQEVEHERQDVQHLKEEREMEVVQEEGSDEDELVLISAQELELEEAEDSPASTLLHGIPSPEALRDGLDDTAVHLREDAEDGGQELTEPGLPNQPVCELQGAGARQAEGAAVELSPQEKAGSLELLEAPSGDTHVQLFAELGEVKESLEAELQLLSLGDDLGTEQAESVGPDVQLLEADRTEPGLEGGAGAAAVLGEGLSPAEIPARSPAPGELVQVSAQELEGKEAEAHGESTGADGKPLCASGLWEGAESPAVALEAAPCMADSTDIWDRNVEPALHPEYTQYAAAEHAHPGLVAVSGPDEQILEETQTSSADAEGRPLDGARGLEVVQGARLEAEGRILVEAQHLELKQGHDADAATLASPVSEVPLQISALNLGAMMQEGVLIPDVQLLGGSGQAAQRQLQEQVSAQADKGRLRTAPRQPQKPPDVMEAEQATAGPAETPKQEVPPASALHTGILQGEDAVKDLSGMALGDSPLLEVVSSGAQLSGEQREELDVEKKQEMEKSPGGEPSPGEPEAVTVSGAGAAPKGSLEPDHLYNVLFVGDSHVGKTSFLYRLHADTFNPHLAATVGLDYQVKNLVVDNKRFALRLWDSAGQERYHSVTKQFFRKADGVVLMYDVTSQYSFANVHYWLSCIQEGAEDGVTVLLLGNKTDCAAERQVPTLEGERLAQEHQLLFYECSAASGHNVTESIVSLVRALKVCEDQLRNKAEEVPKLPQKKKGCCW